MMTKRNNAPPAAGGDSRPELHLHDGQVYKWEFRRSFGPFLREHRERAELSLRKVASSVGVSFTYLQKVETNGRYRAPPPELLVRLARLYDLPLSEVLAEAGVQVRTTSDVFMQERIDAAFALLVLDSRVRPAGMDTRWLASFSPQQKQQWLEFAVKLEVAVSGCSRFVDAITEPANAESAMVLPADWVNDGAELPLEEPS